ncbi:hypothetical protein [Paraburkholderia sp. GAS42]|uniref:hypothetical protein n=1 Tax=Paraburkholderia sp. GAS42 TaxID=3035135 RepID=UPI003D22B0CF
MADPILQASHPLAALPLDSDLALIFEMEDPFLMKPERIQVLIQATEPGELRGFLFGLLDQRLASIYSGGR